MSKGGNINIIQKFLFTASVAVGFALPAQSELLCPNYGRCVDSAYFTCSPTGSSFVKRVCYSEQHSYMILELRSAQYHHCAVDAKTVSAFLAARSKGRFYRERVSGKFDCSRTSLPVLK
jgi:hypothetical protein